MHKCVCGIVFISLFMCLRHFNTRLDEPLFVENVLPQTIPTPCSGVAFVYNRRLLETHFTKEDVHSVGFRLRSAQSDSLALHILLHSLNGHRCFTEHPETANILFVPFTLDKGLNGTLCSNFIDKARMMQVHGETRSFVLLGVPPLPLYLPDVCRRSSIPDDILYTFVWLTHAVSSNNMSISVATPRIMVDYDYDERPWLRQNRPIFATVIQYDADINDGLLEECASAQNDLKCKSVLYPGNKDLVINLKSNSKYCIDLNASNTHWKIADSIFLGCIPVIVCAHFETNLWDANFFWRLNVSVQIKEHRGFLRFLENISEEEYNRKSAFLHSHASMLDMSSDRGLNVLLQQIRSVGRKA